MISKKINVNTNNIFIVVLMAIFFIASINTVSAITALRILDSSISPNVASPGDTLDFVYSINNPSTSNVNNVRLGARIRTYSPQGVWIDDWNNDKIEIIYPGTRNYVRSFKVPPTASLGLYDAQWVIVNNLDETWYDYRTYSPILTIQSNTGMLSITTTPVSGSISVDGIYKGTGSWSGSVSTGSHIVSFGAVSGYTTPSQQTVTVNKGLTTTVTGTYVSTQLRILDSSISPNVASPGDTLSFVYSINNPGTSNVNNVRLGARIRTYSPQGVWIDDWDNDKVEIIYPGTHNYNRSFKVPATASSGLYDAQWVILDNADESKWFDNRTYSPILTIQSNTGTLSITTTPVSGSISVDGIYKGTGSWSGSVSTGSHIVSFGAVSGYTTPSQQPVTVNTGQMTTVTGTYVLSLANKATLVSETYPDNSGVPSGQSFTKTWTLKNSGATTWGSGYKLMYVSGSLSISQADVTVVGSVSPGQSYTFSVPMKAPTTANTYTEHWKLVNLQGTTVPVDTSPTIWAKILVPGGDYLSISTSLSNSYAIGEPVILYASIKNTASTPVQVILQVTSTTSFSESKTLTIPASSTLTYGFNLGITDVGSQTATIKLYSGTTLLGINSKTFIVNDPTSVKMVENEAENLKKAAIDEFDEMAYIPASASSQTIVSIGFDKLSYHVNKFTPLLQVVKSKDANGIITDSSIDLMTYTANNAVQSIGELKKDTVDVFFEEVEDGYKNKLTGAIKDYLIKPWFVKADEDKVIQRDSAFDTYIGYTLFTLPPDSKIRITQRFKAGTEAISNVVESKALFTIEPYTYIVPIIEETITIGRRYSLTLNEQQNKFNEVTKVKKLIVWGIAVIALIGVVLILIPAGTVLAPLLLTISTMIPSIITFLKSITAIIPYVMSLMSIGMILTVPIIAPEVTFQHDQTLDVIGDIISSESSTVSVSKITPSSSYINSPSSVKIEVENKEHSAAQPITETMIYSPDGRIIDIQRNDPYIAAGSIATIDQKLSIPSKPGTYKILGMVHAGAVATSMVQQEMTVLMPALTISMNTDSSTYNIGDTVTISANFTNKEAFDISDLIYVIEVINTTSETSDMMTLSASSALNKTLAFTPDNEGSYIAKATLMLGLIEVATESIGFTLGNGEGMLLTATADILYPPEVDITVPVTVENIGTVYTNSFMNITTYDELAGFKQVFTNEIPLSLAASASTTIGLTILPSATPGVYRTIIFAGNYSAESFEYTVTANGTIYNLLDTDKVYYNPTERVYINTTVNDILFNATSANVTNTISDPSGNITNLMVSGSLGHYISAYIPPMNGTYEIEASSTKTGFRSYDDETFVIVGERSVLNTTIDANIFSYNESSIISLHITNEKAKSIDSVIVTLSGSGINSTKITDTGGNVSFMVTPTYMGTITITIEKGGYAAYSQTLNVFEGVKVNITSPVDGVVVSMANLTVSGTARPSTGLAFVSVNGILAIGTINWNANVTLIEGENSITVIAEDTSGNIATDSITVIYMPSRSPQSINNLSLQAGTTWLNFTWFNPPDPDFSHVMLYLNGTFKTNITAPQNYYNFTGLYPDTLYELGTHTVDTSGNINQTWVNATARTAPDTLTPTPSISVVSPNGAENWERGKVHSITWNYTGSPGTNVKIELLKNGVVNRLITSSTSIGSSGSGSYNWLINSIQTLGTDYKIRITSTTNSEYTDTSNNSFTIGALKSINLIKNPGFESLTANWIFNTNGTGTFTAASPGFEGTKAAKIVLGTGDSNIQLYQTGITLEENKHYRLSFSSYSTTGNDLRIILHKHGSPYTVYGLNQTIDIGTNWQNFMTEFTTENFTGTVNDVRFRFYLAQYAEAGDTYYIDNVFLEKVSSITVTSPNGGENLTRGKTHSINWSSTGSPGTYVKIELLKPGAANKVIISSTLNDGSHPLPILATQAPGNDYKIKITSTTNAAYTDTSDNSFTIPAPSFTIVSPNGGENWRRGTTQTIKWNSTESPKSYVKIELLKAGVLNRVIVASTLNDGSHPWLIPGTQISGTVYKVRITSNANISNKDTSDNNFTIPAPSITVVSPNGGENWTRGTTQTIRWNSTENPKSYVKIELLKPGKANKVIISSTLNDGSHPWLIPATQLPGDEYRVKITSTINASVNDTSDNPFTIPAPSFTVVSPNDSENWTRGTTQTIKWNSTENPKSYVKIELLKPGVANKVIISSTLNDGSHPWIIPATQLPGDDYRVKITSTINASNNDISDDSFTIPAPSITVFSPNDGENWTRGTTQTIRWNSTENPKSYVKIELLKPGVANKVIIASTLNDGSHPWPILATQGTGDNYRIKITSTINASNNDTSDNFSIVPPKITVTSPNGGQTWIKGTNHLITWNYTGNPGTYVKIELLKNGAFNRNILTSTPNDKSQSWTIPTTQASGEDYKIRITSTTNLAYNDTSDSNFNISPTTP